MVKRLIRQGEVVLWAGSGLSLYLGYPSGIRLRDLIHKSLGPEEQKLVDPKSSLMDLTEEYVRLKGGKVNPLIQLLVQIFVNAGPTSTKIHDIITQIPHWYVMTNPALEVSNSDETASVSRIIIDAANKKAYIYGKDSSLITQVNLSENEIMR